MSGELANALELFKALESRRSSDDKFAELLGDISTALADILAAMEKPESKKDEQAEADALGKAIAGALLVGLKSMPAPVISMDLPAQAGAQPGWKRMEIDLNRDASGRIGNKLTLTRHEV